MESLEAESAVELEVLSPHSLPAFGLEDFPQRQRQPMMMLQPVLKRRQAGHQKVRHVAPRLRILVLRQHGQQILEPLLDHRQLISNPRLILGRIRFQLGFVESPFIQP